MKSLLIINIYKSMSTTMSFLLFHCRSSQTASKRLAKLIVLEIGIESKS